MYSCGTCRKKHRESLFLQKSELQRNTSHLFLAQKKILLVLILGRHQCRKEEELEAKSDCSNTFLWFSIVMTRSISWHFRTSPQQSWSTQIIEDTKKQWKAQKILLPGLYSLFNFYDLFDCWIKNNFSPLPFHAERRRRLKYKEARRFSNIASDFSFQE